MPRSPIFALMIVLYLLVAGGIGILVARSGARSRALGFVAGGLGAAGAYALMLYPRSWLRDGGGIEPGWLRTVMRVLYVGSAAVLAAFNAVSLAIFVEVAVSGSVDRAISFFQEPSAWAVVPVKTALVGIMLLAVLSVYARFRARASVREGSG